MKVVALICLLCIGGAWANLSSVSGIPSGLGLNPSSMPSSGNCSAGSPSGRLASCNSILDGWSGRSGASSGSTGVKEKMLTVTAGLTSGNQSANDIRTMCSIGVYYRQCVTNTETSCGSSNVQSSKQEEARMNPMGDSSSTDRFCDGGDVKSDFKTMLEGSNLNTCLQSSDGQRIKQEMVTIGTRSRKRMNRVSDSDMSGAGTGSTNARMMKQRSEAGCATLRSSMNRAMYLFRRYKNSGCNDNAKKLMLQSSTMSVSPGLMSQCNIPNVTQGGALNNNASRSDKNRETVGFYGLSHMRVSNQTDSVITCEEVEANSNITLLQHDHVEISGQVDYYNSASSNATILKSVFVKFRDSNLDEIDAVNMASGNTGDLPSRTSNNNQEIGAQSRSTGGRVEGKITMNQESGSKLQIMDENSGMMLVVRKYNVHGSTPVYSMVARLPKSMLENGGGMLVEGCTSNKDISSVVSSAGRRRRRSTTSDQSTYDATVTGDSSATAMASNAESDISTASATDSTFNNGFRIAVSTTALLFSVVFGFLLR